MLFKVTLHLHCHCYELQTLCGTLYFLCSIIFLDAASRYPDKAKFLANCENLSTAALTKVSNAISCGPDGILFRQLVGHVINLPREEWNKFGEKICLELVEEVLNKKIMLPSALLPALFAKVESLTSDVDRCKTLLQLLNIPEDLNGDTAHQFMLEFILQFTEVALSFICATFRNARGGNRVQKPPIEIDAEDRQVIYYIIGSIMRGYLKMARRYKNATWRKVASAIRAKVLVEKPCIYDKDTNPDAKWVAARDRGGLLWASTDAKEFFISLTSIVFQCEQKDGSISYEEVIKEVSNTPLVDTWDGMIGGALSARGSLNLMNDAVSSFCRTCLSGFVRRRLNFLKQKPVISMPTRHAVARRKK